jgi:hypothetical protein
LLLTQLLCRKLKQLFAMEIGLFILPNIDSQTTCL